MAATATEVADDAADALLGHGDGHQHDRLQQDGICVLERVAHGSDAGELEGDLGGVDGVVGAVVEPYADALDGITGEHAGVHRLADTFLDGGDERARDHAALDLIDELELGGGAVVGRGVAEWLDLDVTIAELPAPTGLLLVASVRLGAAANRLLVRHAGRLE